MGDVLCSHLKHALFQPVLRVLSSPIPGYREGSKLVKHPSLVYFLPGRNIYSIYPGYIAAHLKNKLNVFADTILPPYFFGFVPMVSCHSGFNGNLKFLILIDNFQAPASF